MNLPALPLLLLLALLAACSKREPARLYPLRGTVVRLDKKTNLASIHNEKIEGWMAEMTMEFPVKDRNEYKALRPGEKITATVNVTSEGFWLSNVKERKGD